MVVWLSCKVLSGALRVCASGTGTLGARCRLEGFALLPDVLLWMIQVLHKLIIYQNARNNGSFGAGVISSTVGSLQSAECLVETSKSMGSLATPLELPP